MKAIRWHQDIKPSNILLVSGDKSYPYDVRFKLADFGSSHFTTLADNTGIALDWDSLGTRMYGE